ncbi:MAG: hypothetical protein ACREK8_00265 [Gemmatimonadales bacterium]
MVSRQGQRTRIGWGLACAVLMTALALVVWGGHAALAAAVFGGVAIVMQLLAAWLPGRSGTEITLDHLKVYAAGVATRMLGVVLLAVAVSRDRATFAPWPSALGYLGTVLPLLYLETRLAR